MNYHRGYRDLGPDKMENLLGDFDKIEEKGDWIDGLLHGIEEIKEEFDLSEDIEERVKENKFQLFEISPNRMGILGSIVFIETDLSQRKVQQKIGGSSRGTFKQHWKDVEEVLYDG